MKTYAVILASGSSKRFGGEIPKQFLKIGDKTILEKSIEAFELNEKITDIILVCNPDFMNLMREILFSRFSKLKFIVAGGATRQESSCIGISLIREDDAKVLIHDAARPFVSQEIINNCIDVLDKYQACAVAIPSVDTVIEIDENNIIKNIPQRAFLKRVQTPQGFISAIIKKAHNFAKEDKTLVVTDDCGLVLHYDLTKIFVLNGDEKNIKITTKDDLR